MQDIKIRQEKMREKRKETPRHDYLKEIVSRYPLVFYKHNGMTSRYPETDRVRSTRKFIEFEKERDDLVKK